jgi:hypothetical protein
MELYMSGTTLSTQAAAERRRRAFGLALLSAILSIPPALAGPVGMVTPDRWRPHADVGVLDHVTLRMHWYDSLELLRDAAIGHDVSTDALRGFSILRRNTATGEWVCDVFVLRMRGTFVDKERTVTFGHELLHCFGFRHE